MNSYSTLRRRRAVGAIAVALAVALALAGCSGSSAGGNSDDTFDVLFVGGVTGPYATAGEAAVRGLEAAVAQVNEDGGVNGQEMVLTVKDDQGDPTKGVSVLQETLAESTPDLVIPSGTSAEALAMLPVLTRNELVSINFGANPLLNDPEKYPYHFQSTPSSEAQLVGLQNHLEEAGVDQLGVLVSEDEYGDGVVSAIENQLEDSDITVDATKFTASDVDLRVPYQRMLSGDPDYVYLDTTGDSASRLLQARTQVGAVEIPTIAGSGMSLTAGGPANYGSAKANENLEILVFAVEVGKPESEQSEAFKQFFERYAGDEPIESSLSTPSLAWDQIRLMALAANQDGAMDDYPQSLVDAVYDLDAPDGYWLTEESFDYTPDKHTPTPQPEDFPFIPSSPMKNGQYQVDTKP